MSVPFLLLVVLAAYNIWARREPMLSLYRQGIVIVQIGASSLDGIPLIPVFVRVAWLIISTQGFRRKLVGIPWEFYQDARVSGPPMAHRLTIVSRSPLASEEDLPAGCISAKEVLLDEASFVEPMNQIADAIQSTAAYPTSWRHLPSWQREPLTPA
jgi:hypothetical protein